MRIVEVTAGTELVEIARAMFGQYRGFLETIESTHCFNFERYRQEIAELPGWYTGKNGAVLLASLENQAAGCIAFRAASDEPATTCEFKRLFVLPEFRARGVARTLVEDCLRRTPEHGYTRAILDTDIVSMPTAFAMYRAMGFVAYTPPGTHAPSLRFLERPLP